MKMAPIFDRKLPQFFTLAGARSKLNIGWKLSFESKVKIVFVDLEDIYLSIYRGYIASATLVCFSNSNSKHSWKRVSQFPDSNENKRNQKIQNQTILEKKRQPII